MRLIYPKKQFLSSYEKAFKEYQDNNIKTYYFFNPNECDVIKKIEDYLIGTNLPKNYVKATYLWLVEEDEFIGEISIRHKLTDSLKRYGGHIGYGVRYSKFNMGYGTKMLSLALEFIKENFNFDKVLITCNDDNYGSIKVIENNGGILQDKIKNTVEGVKIITRRYWIDISKEG